MIHPVTVLAGHVSRETAYLIEDYPYGRRLRCQMLVWLEQAAKGAKKGEWRVMRQTSNPKRPGEVWNKPHPGQYSPFVVLYLDSEDGHVKTHGSGDWGFGPAQDARMRLDGTYDQLTGNDRTAYDVLVKIGKVAARSQWESWANAQAFIRDYYTEHGEFPSDEAVKAEPGRWVYNYTVAVAEVEHQMAGAGA